MMSGWNCPQLLLFLLILSLYPSTPSGLVVKSGQEVSTVHQIGRNSTFILVAGVGRSTLSSLPPFPMFATSPWQGHKCLIRCLAVHINDQGTAGCFLKALLPAAPQRERDLSEWLEIHPSAQDAQLKLQRSKGLLKQKTHSAFSLLPFSTHCKWMLFSSWQTLSLFPRESRRERGF